MSDHSVAGKHARKQFTPTHARNDAIRHAISVMCDSDIGYMLAPIFDSTCYGLRASSIYADSPALMDDVKQTIRAINACMRRLKAELDAIDA